MKTKTLSWLNAPMGWDKYTRQNTDKQEEEDKNEEEEELNKSNYYDNCPREELNKSGDYDNFPEEELNNHDHQD